MVKRILDDPAKLLEMNNSEIKTLVEEKVQDIDLMAEDVLTLFDDYAGETGDAAVEFAIKKAKEVVAEELINFKDKLKDELELD
jgi:hypothetical protein